VPIDESINQSMSIDIVNSQVLAAIARSSSLGDSLFFRKNDVSVGFHEQRPSVYPSLCVSREKTRAKTKETRGRARGEIRILTSQPLAAGTCFVSALVPLY